VTATDELLSAFIEAACVPLTAGHASGTLDRAEEIRLTHPEVATADVYAAAVLGDDATVRHFLSVDARSATARGGPREWDALTYLCFSTYLRLDRSRSAGFVRTAEALLDAGASAGTGWYEVNHQPEPEWESAIYGAAGVAHHPELTRLLLDRGADPNEGETPYHAPESWDNAAVTVLLESGKLTPDSLAIMLLSKADVHDYEGLELLLTHGADPNRMTRWRSTALHQALQRDNALDNIELLLDHGAEARLKRGADGRSAVAIAARRGRGDVLDLLEGRDVPIQLSGLDGLLSACARQDAAGVRAIADGDPELVGELVRDGGTPLAEFAGTGNTGGVRHLLDLGVPITAPYERGDAYFGIATHSTALHVAAWRARHATVRLLIERGAAINGLDGEGRTPLALAVRACVDSYWTHLRSRESIEALLRAGALRDGITLPTGYAEADALLGR